MKRALKIFGFFMLSLLMTAVAGYLVATKGISKLTDREQLAEGRVTIAVDKTSPMPVVAYIVKLNDTDLALIDAGMDSESKTICDALHTMGKTVTDVKAILLTHLHSDHTEGVRAFPDAPVYIMKRPAGLEEKTETTQNNENTKPGSDQKTAPIKRIIHYMNDGELFSIQGITFEAFTVPGHTYDSCAILTYGVLFMGDSAAGQYNDKIGSTPPFVSKDRAMNKRELKKLATRLEPRKNEIHWLAFGHQGPLKGLEPLLTWADKH